MPNKRIHIIYTGTVQGVGFRWAAERAAGSLNLTGWVRNVPDGTVEVTAEGEDEDLVAFIGRMKKAMQNYIRDSKVTWLPYTGEFDSFRIEFY